MKKAIAKITAVLVLLTMVFSLAAANAEDSRVYRTLDEILESGTINIGVFSDKMFLNTLFDENAACHFAFGEAYPCITGAEDMTPEELKSAA